MCPRSSSHNGTHGAVLSPTSHWKDVAGERVRMTVCCARVRRQRLGVPTYAVTSIQRLAFSFALTPRPSRSAPHLSTQARPTSFAASPARFTLTAAPHRAAQRRGSTSWRRWTRRPGRIVIVLSCPPSSLSPGARTWASREEGSAGVCLPQ